MNVTQTSIANTFAVGHGTATATPTPIVAADYARKAYKGVSTRATSGTVFVGPSTVTSASGFELPEGKEITIPIEDPSTIFVVGDGDFSWLAV